MSEKVWFFIVFVSKSVSHFPLQRNKSNENTITLLESTKNLVKLGAFIYTLLLSHCFCFPSRSRTSCMSSCTCRPSKKAAVNSAWVVNVRSQQLFQRTTRPNKTFGANTSPLISRTNYVNNRWCIANTCDFLTEKSSVMHSHPRGPVIIVWWGERWLIKTCIEVAYWIGEGCTLFPCEANMHRVLLMRVWGIVLTFYGTRTESIQWRTTAGNIATTNV